MKLTPIQPTGSRTELKHASNPFAPRISKLCFSFFLILKFLCVLFETEINYEVRKLFFVV